MVSLVAYLHHVLVDQTLASDGGEEEEGEGSAVDRIDRRTQEGEDVTGQTWLIRNHSSASFSFESK